MVAALVLASFAASWSFTWLPLVSSLTEGTRTIILTVALSALAAALFPVDGREGARDSAGEKNEGPSSAEGSRAQGAPADCGVSLDAA